MLLVDDILTVPFTSLLWIFREIHNAAEKELAGEADSITEKLRLLYMQLETGKISEQEFDAQEKILLDRLDAIEADPEDEVDEEEAPGSDIQDRSHPVT